MTERRAAIVAGVMATANLGEILAIDFAALLRAALPEVAARHGAAVEALSGLGIAARMAGMGRILMAHYDTDGIDALRAHSSDTVRGWACYVIGACNMTLPDRLAAIRPFANDAHFGVREWAWLAVRPAIAAELPAALALLTPWAGDPSERVRRFACEATRPRGVWCRHLPALRADPSPGRAILEPLREDPATYVQDSVGNWLNDAARTRPDWVRAVVAEWLSGMPPAATHRIARRGLRTIGKASLPP